MPTEPTAEELWRMLLSGQMDWEQDRRRFRLLPAKHRCKNCNAPLDGMGAWIARWLGRGQYKRNPRFCEF
jgi:hypothetical protein